MTFQRPDREPDIEARLTARTREQGGRSTPAQSGYRPNHDFGLPGELNDALHEYPESGFIQPGETVQARLWLFAPERQAGRLLPGMPFTFQEGHIVIGEGEITRVLNPDLARVECDVPTTTLYRPTGAEELRLVKESGSRRWPPRLPEQPIFYPVTNEEYAAQITSQWNAKDGNKGYVTRFEVKSEFMDRYEIQTVGARVHTEWWIPAEDLEELNDNIVGRIHVIWECTGTTP